MRITESKLRSIIRQVIKESAPYVPGALDNSPHFDPEDRGAAPEDRAYAGHDAEADLRHADSEGNRYSFDELGYTVEDGIIYDERGKRVGELDDF